MVDRGTVRVPFHIRADIRKNGISLRSEIKDLSTNGLYIVTAAKESVSPGDRLDITLHLDGTMEKMSVMIQGTVARIDIDGFAVTFLEMDLNSFNRLRDIVAFNSLDQGKIVHEFENSFRDDMMD